MQNQHRSIQAPLIIHGKEVIGLMGNHKTIPSSLPDTLLSLAGTLGGLDNLFLQRIAHFLRSSAQRHMLC